MAVLVYFVFKHFFFESDFQFFIFKISYTLKEKILKLKKTKKKKYFNGVS